MGELINIGGLTKLDLDPDRVLHEAIGEMKGVVIIGFDKDGQVYAASSYANGGTVLWLMAICKQQLLESKGE